MNAFEALSALKQKGIDTDAVINQLEKEGYDTSSLKPHLSAQQQSIQGNWEGNGLQPVPLMIPEQMPARGLAALGDLATNHDFQQASQTVNGAPPQSTAGRIGNMVGQFVKPSDIAIASLVPNVDLTGMKASGPFTAGASNPSSALPGALQTAGQQLGKAESAAPETAIDISDRLRRLYGAGKPGIAKLAEEGIQMTRDNSQLGNATAEQLLTYRDALLQKASNGGRYASDYVDAANNISDELTQRFPNVMNALKNYATTALAKTGSNIGLPWLTGAVNPEIGAAKLAYNVATSAPALAGMGATTNLALNNAGPISSALLDAYQRLAAKRGQ